MSPNLVNMNKIEVNDFEKHIFKLRKKIKLITRVNEFD